MPWCSFVICLIAALALWVHAAFAAGLLTNLTDTVSTHQPNTASDHAVLFSTPTGVDASSDTITLGLASFTLTGVTPGDIRLSHGPTTGAETIETVAVSPGINTWGASISGSTLTLTAPTNAAVGEVASNERVEVLIGLNAGGTNQIINPVLGGDYELVIGGTFGDEGRIGLAVTDNNVDVSATVPPSSTGGGPTGGGGGTNPPIIFNVQATTTSFTTILVTWQTDELANSSVDYGQSTSYASGTVNDVTYVGNHSVSVTGLIPCQTYHFRVRSTDINGNQAISGDFTITMPCDRVAPVISNVQAVNITDTSAMITWQTNEPASSIVEYGLTPAYGSTSTNLGFVTGHAMPLAGLLPNRTYHYRVISRDPSGNTAVSGDFTFTTSPDRTPPANPTFTATPGDGQVTLNWTVPSDPDTAGVRIVRKTGGFPTGPNDGQVIYQGPATSFVDQPLTNGVTYYYGAYAYDTQGNFSSGSLASATPSAQPTQPPVTTPPTGGQLPPGTVPSGPGVTPNPPTPGATILLELFGADGSLPLARGSNGMFGILAGASLEARVPAESLNGIPTVVAFSVDGTTYNLVYDARLNAYVGRLKTPTKPGHYEGRVQAVFTDGRTAQLSVVLNVQNGGRVFERSLLGKETPIGGATVRLFRFEGGEHAPWDGSATGQANPITTDEDGTYAFQVPPGRYYVEVEKDGYWTYFSSPIYVDGNVFGIPIELIKIPQPISSIISPTSTPPEQALAVIENIGDQIIAWLKLLRQFLASAPVIDFLRNILVPFLLVLGLLNAISSIPLFGALALMQLLLDSLFIFDRRKGVPGIVYNAFTKNPLDLVVVRLIHATSGLTVRLRVTDRLGRYWFRAQPGQYRIESTKPGYIFPSTALRGKLTDGVFGALYFGGRILLETLGDIIQNIPMDPVVPAETSRQIRLRDRLRGLQHAVALGSALFAALAFALAPSIGLLVTALILLAIYGLFRRLVLFPILKRKGMVHDKESEKPVGNAIVRLFESKTNKLLDSQTTDRHGKYGFAAQKNTFYVTAEAKKYEEGRVEIDLSNSDETVIAEPIGLERKKRKR